MKDKEILNNYREQIDTLDKELIFLLFRRFEIVKQIWNYKKNNWITSPLDKKRWDNLMEQNLNFSRSYLLNDNLIKDLWDRIHKESLDLEK